MGRSIYLFAYEAPLLLLQVLVLFVIFCHVKKKNGPLSAPFYKLYAFQALADLGSFASTTVAHYNLLPREGTSWNNAMYAATTFTGHTGLLMHTAIALNRYTAIVRPLRHRSIWNTSTLVAMIAGITLVGFLTSIFKAFWPLKIIEYNGELWTRNESNGINAANRTMSLTVSLLTTGVSFCLELKTFVAFRRLDYYTKRTLLEDFRLLDDPFSKAMRQAFVQLYFCRNKSLSSASIVVFTARKQETISHQSVQH